MRSRAPRRAPSLPSVAMPGALQSERGRLASADAPARLPVEFLPFRFPFSGRVREAGRAMSRHPVCKHRVPSPPETITSARGSYPMPRCFFHLFCPARPPTPTAPFSRWTKTRAADGCMGCLFACLRAHNKRSEVHDISRRVTSRNKAHDSISQVCPARPPSRQLQPTAPWQISLGTPRPPREGQAALSRHNPVESYGSPSWRP